MKKICVLLSALIMAALPAVRVNAQGSTNCFLNDFSLKTAVIPPYQDYRRPTAVPTTTLTINFNDTLRKVSKYIFGNAIAVWVGSDVDNPTIIGYLKELSPSLVRFPGGSWSDDYFWNGLPGNLPSTLVDGSGASKTFYPQSGLSQATTFNRYLDLRSKISAQGLITINYAYARYGLGPNPAEQAAHLAADWVRADSGRTKYWEIGNESAGSWEDGYRINTSTNQDGQPEIITGDLYGQHFKIFADSMKKAAAEVGAQIYIGAQLIQYDASGSSNPDKDWNQSVYSEVGDTADFYVIHNYFGGNGSDPKSFLTTALGSIDDMYNYLQSNIQAQSAAQLPIALTEWNITASDNIKTSFINGMQGVLAMSEMAKLGYGMSCRWLIANWVGDGMFYYVSPATNIPLWNPRPAFYTLYYLQKFFGSYMLGSTLSGSTDIKAYPSVFKDGQIGIILVNMGTTEETVGIDLQNANYGNRYYYYSLQGGTDDPDYSKEVYVNGVGPEATRWGPLDSLVNIPARSDTLAYPVKIVSPARSIQYVLLETGNDTFPQVSVDSFNVSTVDSVTDITVDNGTIQMLGNVYPADATDNSVIWTLSDSSVAKISGNGLLTALTNGTVTVTGTTTDGGFTGQKVITISNQYIEVTGITLTTATGATSITTQNGTLQMIANIEPPNAQDKTVTWSVSDTAKASITSDGLLTGKAFGNVTVSCTTHDGGYTATLSIAINFKSSGIEDNSLTGLKVYPIPASDRIFIENNTPVDQYQILNIEGKVLRTIDHPGLLTEVDISTFDRGVYLLRAKTETSVAVIRFVK